jgi:uncharacterized repeat protein (TIGR01451 family)
VAAAVITTPTSTPSVADIAITKTVDNATPHVGDTVHYSLNVTDAGPASSTAVVATDVLPSGLTFENATASVGSYVNSSGIWTIGALPVGSTATLAIAALVNAGTASTTITNTGTVTENASTTDSNLANNTASVSINVQAATTTPTSTIQNADIAIVKTADVSSTVEGATVHYTLTATDLGPATSTGVVANDVLPSGLTFVSASASVGTYATSTGIWNIGTMTANSPATLTVAATVNAGTASSTISNTATIAESASSTDTNLANNSSTVTISVAGNPGPGTCSIATALGEVVSNKTPNVGDTITYTLVGAPAFTAPTHLIVTDLLPFLDLSFVSASTSDGTYASSTGVWDLGTLNGSNVISLSITANVNPSAAGKTITMNPSVEYIQSNCTQTSAVAGTTIVVQTPTVATTTADIAIVKTVDVPYTFQGATLNYTLTVSANGPATSTGVVASDTLPSDLTFVSATTSAGSYDPSTGLWTIGDMGAGSTSTLTIAAKVDSDTPVGTTLTNTGTVTESASSTDPNLANNSSTVSINVTKMALPPLAADISIAKAVDTTSTVAGATINYTITATDLGPATSTGVVATDTLPSGLTFVSANASVGTSYSTSTGTWTIGTLSPNATATLAIAATVNAAAAGTTVTNTAFVAEAASSTDGTTVTYTYDPNLANNSSSVSTTITPNSVSCSLSASQFYTDLNNGTITAGSIVLNAASGTASFSIVNRTQCTAPISLASYKMFVVPNGPHWLSTQQLFDSASSPAIPASSTTTFVVNVAPCMTQIDSFYGPTPVTLLDSDPYQYPNVPFVLAWMFANNGDLCGGSTSSADIAITKTADTTSTVVGTTINYTITATDLGPDAATGVTATDTLPSGLSFVSATSSSGTAYNFGSGTWTIGTLSPNATATLAIAATVNPGAAGTTVTNTATIAESASSTDPNLANNSSTVSTVVAGGGSGSTADISIVKTVDNAYPNPGATVNYTLTVANAGPSASEIDTAQDVLPSGLTFVSATSSSGTAYNFGSGKWTIGTLAPNATATLAIAAVVGLNEGGQTITNTATVSQLSSINDLNLGNNSSSVSIFVATSTPYADIAIAKAVDKSSANPGDTLNYTVTVSDLGPATSTGVVATDTLPSGLTFVSATTSAGTYATSTGTWTIGDMSASSTATLTIAATVNAGTAGTTITNTGTVGESASTTDPNPANNTASASTVIPGGGCGSNCGGCVINCGGGESTAEIAIAKTVDNANPSQGATIHYTVTVSALGPSESLGVNATDTLPAGVALVSASTTLGSYNTSTGAWSIGNLDDGQTAVLVITATVTASAGTSITNTGTVRESPTVNDQLSGNNTASVTITVAGGGGGGGGGGGQVLGASTSTGQVLGENTCGLYLYDYIHPNRKNLNDPNEVRKLQEFLNLELNAGLPITGYYGPLTIAAVNKFQVKYHSEVLLPWIPLGLPTEFTPTSYVYETTKRWINLIVCPSLNLSEPTLQVDNGE